MTEEGEIHEIPARGHSSSRSGKKDNPRFHKGKGGAVTLSGTRSSDPPASPRKPVEKGEGNQRNRETSGASYSGQSRVSHQKKGKGGRPKSSEEDTHPVGCRCDSCQETY
jgi:hypothetical protein